MMLERLREIVQEVNAAKDLKSALDIIVSRVKTAMNTQVCSVYLLDTDLNSHVLMASEGLNESAVGHVSLQLGEGLVGLVAQNAEPVNLEDAPAHPRYHYISETGEEKFHSFLGVPIIHHRNVLGVLVVQHREKRLFDEGEEAFLITLSAQLAGVIASAEATGALQGLSPSGQKRLDISFRGISGSSGVAIGKAVVMFPRADLNLTESLPTSITKFSSSIRHWMPFDAICKIWPSRLATSSDLKSANFLMSICACLMTMRWAQKSLR
jgi:phosphotransferase system, enzyme I, PtsP